MLAQPTVFALVSHGAVPSSAVVPTIVHAHTATASKARRDSFYLKPAPSGATVYTYQATSPYFVVPAAGAGAYAPLDAGVAHTRSLVFLREQLGGPYFDLEAIWEEHTHYEFEERSVAKTMGTMVAEPYVNHVPTITGGVGREKLFEFYRDHFIFNNPESTTLTSVSRTVGADRVVDEFVFSCTHDRQIDWLLPGVPPTHRQLEIPMMAVVNIRGDRLYHEHIWWDQATALKQAGLLPDTVPLPNGGGSVRLPVTGAEAARMLLDEQAVESNFMFGSEWGVQS
ncbi:hypothetical protein VHUM_02392 [Vanrija humicola]|uniref:SnoaL-like domain-containing protein n=1 Tax=Vanrija humicola TaxID=5417 RepID=A0A7D8YY29_VANHU|nr:hypothetical protein VHUM_02392 [Vanrija humicola]